LFRGLMLSTFCDLGRETATCELHAAESMRPTMKTDRFVRCRIPKTNQQL